MKTLITGGMLVTPEDVILADLLLADGRVAAWGQGLSGDGARVVDASGRYVLPGGVDAHTHITLDLDAAGGTDVFYQGTIPAAMGGTTTIIDHMAFGPKNRPPRRQAEMYRALAENMAAVDYGFHGVIQRVDDEILADLGPLFDAGYTSFKAYMTYDHRLDDAALYKLLRRTCELGIILTVHAENHDIITALRAECKALDRKEPLWHARSRPARCEAEAVSRLLHLAALAGDAPVYVVHLSTALGLEEIKKARAAGQKNIFAETCPQYLTLTEAKYADPVEGLNYIMSPPLRTQADADALWQGIREGHIQTVATDHCSFSLKDKRRGLHDFTACPGGAPGMEERLTTLFSQGVMQKRISMQTFVEVVSAAPARIFGLYPRKGSLLPGADADVLILRPEAEHRLQAGDLHGPGDYSLYEGMELQGCIEAVFLRGTLIAEKNIFTGQRGKGHFLRRERGMA